MSPIYRLFGIILRYHRKQLFIGYAAVFGAAASDSDFGPGSDRIRYSIAVDPAAGPFTVTTELWFQPVGYRWAENLAAYDAFETNRFVRYYRDMAAGSALMLVSACSRITGSLADRSATPDSAADLVIVAKSVRVIQTKDHVMHRIAIKVFREAAVNACRSRPTWR
ncbi:MAG: hypothetical protein IH927_07905 [Proteobacteria bacterium]|nr:hypothetical protein [Pseudomonadota bacterium]